MQRDAFFDSIRDLARSAPIDTVLEIGSSTGSHSTPAWVDGLRMNPRKPQLYCLEVSHERRQWIEEQWGSEGFVKCFPVSPVDLKTSSSEDEGENARTGLVREIKRSCGIENFGAVMLNGSQRAGGAELDAVYGAEFILLDDTQGSQCHEAHQRLLRDPAYELVMENPGLRHGCSIFRRRRRASFDPLPPDAPVHYFTIVLNGDPFIRHHVEVLKLLPFRWHWHVVEGAAALTHDTAWSVAAGGTLPDDHHCDGLSVDGTSAYLDHLASSYPNQISIYRPPGGRLWDGKVEMVSEPIKHILEDCVLWQIDSDELWTVDQLVEGRRMFLEHPEKGAAMFWCDYFVGESLVVSTRHCYSQNPSRDWLRAWSFQPGMKWNTHEPPMLCRQRIDGAWTDVARGRIFSHAETEARGLVFQHFAYATEAQAAFKEHYYGHARAVDGWRRLQQTRQFPTLLRDAFSWVTDHTEVDTAANLNIVPLAQRDASGSWQFTQHSRPRHALRTASPTIVVDGIFFQLNNTGIARLWLELFKQWVACGVSNHVWVLDRDGATPHVPGIRCHRIGRFNPENPGSDSFVLQEACDALGADVFISTYYSCPISTPCVAMIYDMIPERLNLPPGDWQWEHKSHYLLHSGHFVCISQATAHDLRSIHPEITPSEITVACPAAPPEYKPAPAGRVADFRKRHGLLKDYIVLSGERIGIPVGTQGYKNAALAFRAWSLLPKEERESLMILCTGGKPELEESLRLLAPDAGIRVIRLSEEDLALAYSGAVALVYPSLYEGFGLPVIEAMACGCPVITCRRASLVEVAGDAALYVNPWDPFETASAITALRSDPHLRSRLVTAGFHQSSKFDFARMASSVASVLFDVASRPARPDAGRLARTWEALRRMQTEDLQPLRNALAGRQRESSSAQASLEATQEALRHTQKSLKENRNALKETQKSLKGALKAKDRSDRKLKEMLEKGRSPLKRLWNRLRPPEKP